MRSPTSNRQGSTQHGPHRDFPWIEEELTEAAEALGPFVPPVGFDHGHEFDSVPPRPILPSLRRGSYENRWRRMTRVYLVMGLGCVIVGGTSLASDLSYYVMVLRILPYIGVALCLMVAGRILVHRRRLGPYEFVRDGTVITGRVLKLGSVVLHSGEAKQFHLAVGTEFVDPDSGAHTYKTLFSDRICSLSSESAYSIALNPGDYVTIVGYPDRFLNTARLYGFLGLGFDVVRRHGRPTLSTPGSSALILLALGSFVLFVGIPIFIYVTNAFAVISGPDRPWIMGTAVAAGGTALAAILAVRRRASTRKCSDWATAGFAGLFFGALAGFFGTSLANGLFDRSKPTYRDVDIKDFWQETIYPFFVRNYEVEYSELPGSGSKRFPMRHDRMAAFTETFAGVAETHDGAFGMRWIKAIHPIVLVPKESDDADELVIGAAARADAPDDAEPILLKAIVLLPDGKQLAVSDRMTRHLRQRMATD